MPWIITTPPPTPPLTYPEAVLGFSPSAYWRLEESSGPGPAADSSGNSRGLVTIGAGVTRPQTGKVDNAYLFSGGAGGVAWRSNTDTPLGNGLVRPCTFNAWIYVNAYPSSATSYLYEQTKNIDGDTNFRVWIDTAGRVSYRISDPATLVTSTNPVGTGAWKMVSVVWENDNTVRHFLDASPNGTGTGATSYTGINPTRYGIANNLNSFDRGFDGLMDEVALFTTPLTQANLQTIFNAA